MLRHLKLLVRRRLTWLLLLLAVWLLCSGQAQAGVLGDDPKGPVFDYRIQHVPSGQALPSLAPAQGDLVYPDWFQGTWQLTSTLVELTAPLAPALTTPGFEGNQTWLHQPVTCVVRFLSVPKVSWGIVPLVQGQSQVISDRAFNGLNLARAYLSDGAVKAVKVDPSNPNRQVTLLDHGRQLTSTVTARGTETPSPERFVTTERFQQVFSGTAIPYLNQVDIITDYSQTPAGIVADQVTAVYLSPQDPEFFKALDQPVALYHYRLTLIKVDSPPQAATTSWLG
jgi:hypothetical protein